MFLKIIYCFAIVSSFTLKSFAAITAPYLQPVDPFTELVKDCNSPNKKCSDAIVSFCKKTQIDSIHSMEYYQRTAEISKGQKQIKKYEDLAKVLAIVNERALKGEFATQEKVALIKSLELMQTNILKDKPIGLNNMKLAYNVSFTISGLIIQVACDPNFSAIDECAALARKNTYEEVIHADDFKQFLGREFHIDVPKDLNSIYDIVAFALKRDNPELFWKTDTNAKDDLLSAVSEFYFKNQQKPKDPKTRNVYVFLSEYLIVTAIQVYARLAPVIIESDTKKLSMTKEKKIFKQELDKNTSQLEKHIVLGTLNPQGGDYFKVWIKTKQHTEEKGENILAGAYKMAKGGDF
jgi:hypothetical protein